MDSENQATPAHPDLSHVEGIGPSLLDKVIEALVFAADEPTTRAVIASIYSEVSGHELPSPSDIDESVERINDYYEAADRAFRIREWAGGLRMASVPEMAPYIQTLKSQDQRKRITRSLMETVAILAYRQPVAKSEIESVRGVNCDYAIRRLLEHGLIDVIGRSEGIGRALLYGTTDRFLELFGLNAVSDLPNLREIEEILADPAFQNERAKLLMTSGLDSLSSEESLDAIEETSTEVKDDAEI
ncbi:MAG: SMC-Scp complex subunit ScpB [Rhodothermia bacterium]|nr:MAG: SMC-Scp complex subunit ScpB [Rhodothermia bacterium]